ncbi:hypothetical protein GGS20DRAFT_548731 [Poronia punctata]|nr:hypothetical protein GGS20DRAFT_548731 [Poronia punctata]
MADVDDEFLALVGGDDASDDEQDVSDHSRPASQTPEPDADQDQATPAKPRRRRDESDEEEEGEASSVAGSEESAPMDESDSDAESPPSTQPANAKMEDDEELKYPVEGIYASEAEKEEILAMPELEREQLIAKRQEEIDRQRQNTLLRRLLQKNKQDSSLSTKKRKAGSAELEDGQRKTSRQRTKIGGSKVGETSAGIASLRRARAEKFDRQRRREEDRERKGKSSTKDSIHGDDDRESDVEWGNYGRKPSRSETPEQRAAPPAELRDFERVRLSRSRFAEVCFYPGFDDAITGCYCRVAVGPNRETGETEYQMGAIKGFTQGRPYAMQKLNKAFVTDQYVKLAHGKTVREYPFISCSDSPFTDADYHLYQRICQHDGLPFPKKDQVDAKIDDINALRNRTWTEKEVNDRLARIQSLKKKYDSSERNRLLNKIEEAKDRGDEARAAELQEQLDKLEVHKLAFRTSLTQTKKSTPSTPSQQDRLAQVNIQRRRDNAEAVRKAQIMERARVRMIEAKMARGEDVEDDTSRRVKTKPKFMQVVNESEASAGTEGDNSQTPAGTTPANGTPTAGTPKVAPATKTTTMLPHLQKLKFQNHQAGKDKNGIPQIHKPIGDDDIIAALDLDIDVEID